MTGTIARSSWLRVRSQAGASSSTAKSSYSPARCSPRCANLLPPRSLPIDEIDRADEEFEAFLFELLGEFQVTIPELGTITAETRPLVILTSNRTRELHDALKRRCLYEWIDYPSVEREQRILDRTVPEAAGVLAKRIAEAAAVLRREHLDKHRELGSP